MMKMFRKRDEGFTLIELMVVVLIIGILVAIAIPVFNAARANAWRRSCHANQRTIEGAAQTYQAENDQLPANVTAMVPAYIKADSSTAPLAGPKCPRPNSSASIQDATPGYGAIDASGSVGACTGGDTSAADHGHY